MTGVAAEQMMLPLRNKNNRFKKFALISWLRGDSLPVPYFLVLICCV